MAELMSMDNPVYKAYLFYSALLVLKMLFMVVLTGKQRHAKMVFSNPEDVSRHSGAKIKFDDPDVERVRRAHLNDLENIPAFVIVAFTYLMTDPAPWIAINLFRLAAFGRILHTVVYAIFVLPQPARGIGFAMGFIPTVYMAMTSVLHFL